MPAVQKLKINYIIIAIPSLRTHELQVLYKECVRTGVSIKIMPHFDEMLLGTRTAGQIRDVKAEDLLGRKPVTLDTSEISNRIKGKTVLVTGAGGSIGSENCRQISAVQRMEHNVFAESSIQLCINRMNAVFPMAEQNNFLRLKRTDLPADF